MPLVLYPDPEKDPTSDSVVEALWREFDAAFDGATHILVLGHSLHDPALVERLKHSNSADSPVGVVVRVDEEYFASKKGNYKRVKGRERVRRLLPSAVLIPGFFSREPHFDSEALERWIQGKPEPAVIESGSSPSP